MRFRYKFENFFVKQRNHRLAVYTRHFSETKYHLTTSNIANRLLADTSHIP